MPKETEMNLIERLRGKYPVGPILENGEPEYGYRHFDNLPPISAEAADELERLSAENEELKAYWKQIAQDAFFADFDKYCTFDEWLEERMQNA